MTICNSDASNFLLQTSPCQLTDVTNTFLKITTIVSNQGATRAIIAKKTGVVQNSITKPNKCHRQTSIEQASRLKLASAHSEELQLDEQPLENMKDLLVLLLCSTILASSAADNLQRQRQEANWEFQLSHRVIDTQITKATLEADTMTGCSFSCSNQMGEEGLSLYFVQETNTCFCNMAVDTRPENESVAEIYYGTLRKLSKKEQDDEQVTVVNTEWPYISDCLRLYQAGHNEDGVYRIDPIGGAPTDAWCDMTNGGWTVIQRRKDGSENFYRGWSDYVNGFGNRNGEYWLGLENIHRLTQNGSHLEVFLESFPDANPTSLTANYTSFVVGDNATKYTLQVDGFTGSCRDSLASQNGFPFSTYDKENYDIKNKHCAVVLRGAWWYYGFSVCSYSNLNGYYYQAGEYNYIDGYGNGIRWVDCWSQKHSAKTSVMKIRSP